MTNQELEQKHLQAIFSNSYSYKLRSGADEQELAAAKQCALITLQHTIDVLDRLKFSKLDLELAGMITRRIMTKANEKIDSKILELQKQKEELL